MTKDLTLDFEYLAVPEKKESKFRKQTDKFIYSYWYPFVLGLCLIIGWYFKVPAIGFGAVSFAIGLILIYTDDLTPLVLPLLEFVIAIPPNPPTEEVLPLAGFLAPIIIGLIYHFIKYPIRFKKVKMGKYFYPQLAVSIVLILGGLGSNITAERYFVVGLPQGLGLGIAVLLLYWLTYNFSRPDKYDAKIYLSKLMTGYALTYAVFIFLFYFANPNGIAPGDIKHSDYWFGSMNATASSHIILTCFPFAMYLAIKIKHGAFIHIAFIVFEVAMSILSYTRGTLIVFAFMIPVVFITAPCIVKGEKRKELLWCYLFYGILLIIAAVLLREQIKYVFEFILNRQSGGDLNQLTSGRIELYKEARLCFEAFPLFGVGLGYENPNGDVFGILAFYWFHSTFWQVLATLGLVGFFAYIYNYYWRFKIITHNIKKNMFNIFMLFAMIGFEAYSLLDANSFIPMPFMFMIGMFTGLTENINKNDEKVEEEQKYKDQYSYLNV